MKRFRCTIWIGRYSGAVRSFEASENELTDYFCDQSWVQKLRKLKIGDTLHDHYNDIWERIA